MGSMALLPLTTQRGSSDSSLRGSSARLRTLPQPQSKAGGIFCCKDLSLISNAAATFSNAPKGLTKKSADAPVLSSWRH